MLNASLLLQKRAIIAIAIAAGLIAAIIPTAYGVMQRAAITSLKFHFQKVELSNVDFSNTQTIGSMQQIVNGLDNPSINTLRQVASIQSAIASPESVALDLVANTKFSYNMFIDVTNPSSIDAVIDRADISVSISGHQLPGLVSLSEQETIPSGQTKTIELQGITVSGKDIASILVNTISNDFVLTFDFGITSHFPSLFGDVPIPANVDLKTYVISPKPTLSSFQQAAYNQNSYSLSFTNNDAVPITGTLQVGVMKGNFFSTIGMCDPACIAPIDSGLATFIRIHGASIFGIQVLEYPANITAGGTFNPTIENPEVRSNHNAAFIMRWVPDFSVIPYTMTTSIAGITERSSGEFHSSTFSTFSGITERSSGEFHSSTFSTFRDVIYNVVRDFGYVGYEKFLAPNLGSADSGLNSNVIPTSSGVNYQDQTSITLQASSYSVSDGGIVTFSGMLADSNGQGIANMPISIKSDTPLWSDPSLGTTYTDSNGQFSVTWTAHKPHWYSNTAHVYAAFDGSSSYASSKSSDLTLQVITQTPTVLSTTITVSASTYYAVYGSIIIVSGQLTDQNGDALSNYPVQIKQDRSFAIDPVLTSGSTDSNGYYSLSWTPESTGQISIYAVFNGDSQYTESRSTDITVNIYQNNGSYTPPTQSSSPSSQTIANSVYKVPPGQFVDIPFTLSCTASVQGSFSAEAALGDNIIVYVMDDTQFSNYQNGATHTSYYYSGKVGSGTFNVTLSPSSYHIVLDNTYSSFSTKTVSLQASSSCS